MAERTGNLRLPQSPRAAVFRKIVDQLRADPELKAKGVKWRVWDGSVGDPLPWSATMAPGARLTPQGEAPAFMSPDAFLSTLTIQVELGITSLHLDDAENLFWAFVRALHPADRAARLAAMQARRDAGGTGIGAQTGLIQFSGVSYDTPPEANPPLLIVTFAMQVQVALAVNP